MKQDHLIPVIIGGGQISDRGNGPDFGPAVVTLMAEALQAADRDAGGGWLPRVDFLGIENQISSEVAPWPGDEPITPYVLAAAGIAPRLILLTDEPSGDGPIFLLNHAANLIATGEAEVAAIVGAEALRTAARRAAAHVGSPGKAMRDLLDKRIRPYPRRYGLVTPSDVYPLYETATRAAWGQSFEEAQRESAILWSAYSAAAAANEGAWLREALPPEAILSPSDSNRMVTYPYTKLMVANNAVNQGAALIVTSLARARELGVPEERILFVGAGAAAHEDEDFLARDSYAGSPAMAVSIGKALELNGLNAADLDVVELYSCFPCVAKMARRILDWPLDRLPSVYGGLTFGGGPIGNCMMHAAVVMAQKLRARGRHGLIYANGGFATHNHTIVLTRDRPADDVFPQDFDYQSEADRLRGPIPPLDECYAGPGRIEAYSVPYGRDGRPGFGTIIGLSPQGARFAAYVPNSDEAVLHFLTSGRGEPVGTYGQAISTADGRAEWRPQ